MVLLWQLLLQFVKDLFRSRAVLQVENLLLRQQVNLLKRKHPKRLQINQLDRWIWTKAAAVLSDWKQVLVVVQPKTVVRWHQEGFWRYWKWKSKYGQIQDRPKVSKEVRGLIRKMCQENPTWGAPRITGELQKLGYEIGGTAVGKYMIKVDCNLAGTTDQRSISMGFCSSIYHP
jgi:putative transposase